MASSGPGARFLQTSAVPTEQAIVLQRLMGVVQNALTQGMQASTIKEMLEKQGTSPALMTQVFLMLDQQEKAGQQMVAPKSGLITQETMAQQQQAQMAQQQQMMAMMMQQAGVTPQQQLMMMQQQATMLFQQQLQQQMFAWQQSGMAPEQIQQNVLLAQQQFQQHLAVQTQQAQMQMMASMPPGMGGSGMIPGAEAEGDKVEDGGEDGTKNCGGCGKPVFGRAVEARDQVYHPDHFVCWNCSQPFVNGRYLVGKDGHLYCEEDYNDLMAKRCKTCDGVIKGKIAKTSIGYFFHPEHFICMKCGTSLLGKKYKISDDQNRVLCSPCKEEEIKYLNADAHICAKCSLPIVGEYLLINSQYFHPSHYRCHECGVEFSGGDCREFEGDLYCVKHYKLLILKKCARCNKPIKGRAAQGLGKLWHPEHFCCHICGDPFGNNKHYEVDGLAYCEGDWITLYGDKCYVCKMPLVGEKVTFLGKTYHADHFYCSSCEKVCKPGEFTSWDNKPICKTCYYKLPEDLRKRVEKRLKAEKLAKVAREREEAQAAAAASAVKRDARKKASSSKSSGKSSSKTKK